MSVPYLFNLLNAFSIRNSRSGKLKILPRSSILSVSIIALCAPWAVPAQEKAHNFPISIANPVPSGAVRNGPLFKQFNADVDAVAKDSGKSLRDSLASNVEMSIFPRKSPIIGQLPVFDIMRTIMKDCQGPYAIDEGRVWVQTSWVCHVGKDRSIRKYFTFKDSPELSIEFRFDGGKISSVLANELIWVPGTVTLRMDAAETKPDKR